jgi:hypothetical protein
MGLYLFEVFEPSLKHVQSLRLVAFFWGGRLKKCTEPVRNQGGQRTSICLGLQISQSYLIFSVYVFSFKPWFSCFFKIKADGRHPSALVFKISIFFYFFIKKEFLALVIILFEEQGMQTDDERYVRLGH